MRNRVLFFTSSILLLSNCSKGGEQDSVREMYWYSMDQIVTDELVVEAKALIPGIGGPRKTTLDAFDQLVLDIHPSYLAKSFEVDESIFIPFFSNLRNKVEQEIGQEYSFVYAGISGDITITADRKIGGVSPGENIADFFEIISIDDTYSRYRCNYGSFDDFVKIESGPVSYPQYFYPGSVLPVIWPHIVLAKTPEAGTIACTFTISFPVITETWANYGWNVPVENETKPFRLLKGSVSVSLGKEVTAFHEDEKNMSISGESAID